MKPQIGSYYKINDGGRIISWFCANKLDLKIYNDYFDPTKFDIEEVWYGHTGENHDGNLCPENYRILFAKEWQIQSLDEDRNKAKEKIKAMRLKSFDVSMIEYPDEIPSNNCNAINNNFGYRCSELYKPEDIHIPMYAGASVNSRRTLWRVHMEELPIPPNPKEKRR